MLNVGVNDLGVTSESDYETYLAYTLDAVHVAWPSCKVRVAYPWKRGYDTQSDTMAGWIDTVLATRGAWASAGHDERVWLKGADNGATMTHDGIHYSTAGNAEAARQWKTVLGY